MFLPREFYRQRSLAGYSPRGCKESDKTKWLTLETKYIAKTPFASFGLYGQARPAKSIPNHQGASNNGKRLRYRRCWYSSSPKSYSSLHILSSLLQIPPPYKQCFENVYILRPRKFCYTLSVMFLYIHSHSSDCSILLNQPHPEILSSSRNKGLASKTYKILSHFPLYYI